jgi:hypothetical protein
MEESNVVPFPVPSVANSMADINEASTIEYLEIKGFKAGQMVWIGSLTAGDIIEWSEAGDDKEAKRTAGLRLLSKSLVSVEEGTGKPGPTSVRYANDDASIAVFRKKNQADCQRVIAAVLELNDLTPKADAAAKKD